MSVQPHNPEAGQPAELPADVPQDAIELLGADRLAGVESLAGVVAAWVEVAVLPDPFVTAGYMERPKRDYLYDPAHAAVVETIDNLSSHDFYQGFYQNSVSAETAAAIEEQLPVLAEAVARGRRELEVLQPLLETQLADLTSAVDRREADAEQLTPQAVADLRAELIAVACQFPRVTEVQGLFKLAQTEDAGNQVRQKIIGASQNPDLVARMRRILTKGTWASKDKGEWEVLHRSMLDAGILHEAAAETPEAAPAARDAEVIVADKVYLRGAHRQLTRLEDEGQAIFARLAGMTREAMTQPVNELLTTLKNLKQANQDSLHASDPESYRLMALAVERYLAERSTQLEAQLRLAEFTPTLERRRELRGVKEEPLRRAYDRELKQRAGREAARAGLEQTVPDPDFRKSCSVAKLVLSGGGKLQHPKAALLATEIHALNLGQKAKIQFGKPEQGLLVAILTGKLTPLLKALERAQAADAERDAQVNLWKQEMPQQALAVRSFDIKGSVGKLRQALIDPVRRNELINPLNHCNIGSPGETIDQLFSTVNELYQRFEPSGGSPTGPGQAA